MVFRLNSVELALLLVAIVFGATAGAVMLGLRHRQRSEMREPFAVLQGALLGIVGLILAFGLSLAVGRYQDRRAAVVNEANAIGTTYLRAQMLAEPVRGRSLALLVQYTDQSIQLSSAVPGSAKAKTIIATQNMLQRRLWALAGQAVAASPVDTAPRLYVETLNEMIDSQGVRVAGLNNRVPTEVWLLEILGAATAVAMLAFYLSVLGRGLLTVMIAAGLVTMLLFVSFDLDRPTRGRITVPNTPLVSLRASMSLPPAASGPAQP
ncbi:MAG TPA: hypothetical protein VGQ45_11870 [Gaiellales bacterium]|nr:hypothetical protein [Gaiellales bacterium]